MSFIISTWGSYQWTFYALGVGLLAGIIGNIWASYFMHYKEEQARIKNKPVNWTNEFRVISLLTGLVILSTFILAYFT